MHADPIPHSDGTRITGSQVLNNTGNFVTEGPGQGRQSRTALLVVDVRPADPGCPDPEERLSTGQLGHGKHLLH
jgi:hypothetical protein